MLSAGRAGDGSDGNERDALDFYALARGAALGPTGGHGGDGFEHLVAFDQLAEGGVLFVEELGVAVAEEELGAGAVRVGGAGGGEHAAHVRLRVELGFDLVAGATGAGHATRALFGVGAAALDHEAFDNAVKRGAVVEALLGEFLEVFDVAGGDIGPEFQGDFTLGGGDDCDFFGGAHR